MRSYEKVLLVPMIACVAALAALFAAGIFAASEAGNPSHEPGRGGSESGSDPAVRRDAEDETGVGEAGVVANGARDDVQNPRAADPSSFLLCAPEAALGRVVDRRTRTAVAADEAGHLAFYGGASGDEGTLTNDSYEILTGCLPQLAYTNHATVLVEGRGPEAAGPDTLRAKTRRADDGSLLTSFSFAGGVHLDQRLYLEDGALRAAYTLTNDSRARTGVSLRALVSPTADLGPSRDGRVPRFFVDLAGGAGRRAVEAETEIEGEKVTAVDVPRSGAASDSSGRLLFGAGDEGRRPELLAFASTLDLTAARFRHPPAQQASAWPLPPSSSVAVYWLYEDVPAGGSTTFSYRYEPAPREDAN